MGWLSKLWRFFKSMREVGYCLFCGSENIEYDECTMEWFCGDCGHLKN